MGTGVAGVGSRLRRPSLSDPHVRQLCRLLDLEGFVGFCLPCSVSMHSIRASSGRLLTVRVGR